MEQIDTTINTEYKTEAKEISKGKFRKEVYPVEYVVNGEIGRSIREAKGKVKHFIILDGDKVKVSSQRLKLFMEKGCKCSKCGIEGKYFAKERHINDGDYHLELYAVDSKGEEVIMSKDHILPRSKGGENRQYNYQPMCVRCNFEKGNKVEE